MKECGIDKLIALYTKRNEGSTFESFRGYKAKTLKDEGTLYAFNRVLFEARDYILSQIGKEGLDEIVKCENEANNRSTVSSIFLFDLGIKIKISYGKMCVFEEGNKKTEDIYEASICKLIKNNGTLREFSESKARVQRDTRLERNLRNHLMIIPNRVESADSLDYAQAS